MKIERHQLILDIIASEAIETQEELIHKLKERGVETTQATISRDIRKLHLTKATSGNGAYRYVVPQKNEAAFGSGFRAMITEAVNSVEAAQNIIVLHTHSGMAQPVALGIDSLGLPELLGCVAGDDTVITVAKDSECAAAVASRLHDLLRNV